MALYSWRILLGGWLPRTISLAILVYSLVVFGRLAVGTPTPGGSAPAWAGRLQTVAAAGGIEEEHGDVDSGEGEGE